jgi:hypothetical protein
VEGWEKVEEDECPGQPQHQRPKKTLRKSVKLFGKIKV